MFAIVVNEKGGEQKRLEFDKPEVTIGRVQGNDIILPKGNVSKRHSRIVLKDGKFIIVDLKSTNGTYVNGRKITSPLVLKETEKVYIGDFILTVEEGAAQPHSLTPLAPPPAAIAARPDPLAARAQAVGARTAPEPIPVPPPKAAPAPPSVPAPVAPIHPSALASGSPVAPRPRVTLKSFDVPPEPAPAI